MDPNPEPPVGAIQVNIHQVNIQVNGEPRTCPAGLNLEQALAELGFQPRLVVVEVNGTILPRQRWPQLPVQESDSLEVVTIVGGGS